MTIEPPSVPLRYAPQLIEDVVTRELRRRAAAGGAEALERYHAAREALYEQPVAAREPAFAHLHARLFHDLGFAATVTAVVAAHGAALAAAPMLTIERARGGDDEAADLGKAGPAGRPAVVRIVAQRFFDDTLAPFLDHELAHLGDLLDPAFAHDPDALEGLPVHRRRAVQQRYRLAWATSVDGRLARAGRTPLAERREHRAVLAGAFAPLGPAAIDDVLQRLWAGPRPPHRDLLALATTAPAAAAGGDGAPCPLCRFPTYRWAPPPTPAMCEAIRRVAPEWRAGDGLCDRCSERLDGSVVAG